MKIISIKHYLFSFFYIVVSLVMGAILSNGLIMFLGWNMILATVVIFLAHLFSYLKEHKKHPIVWITCFILWVLFLPNAFYIITDFIHFQNYQFFTIYPHVYSMQIIDWIVFTHIVIGALYSLKIGVDALDIMIRYVKKNRVFVLVLLCLAASFGIYLGRFMRLNSWDIFKVTSLLDHIIKHFSFIISFVLMMTTIQLISYIMFKKDNIFFT